MSAATTATDAELVTRAADGERAAFTELFERYADTVHDHVARWSRDSELAADATQEAFVSLLRNLDSLRDGQAVLAWLLRTARNRAIDQLRKGERERDRLGAPIATAVLTALPTDQSASPETAAMTHETAELVWEVAAGLDERTFTVLDLHVRQELTGPEIAAVMDTSPDNANVLVHRMRERMRVLFGAVLLLRMPDEQCEELEALRATMPTPVDLPSARRIRDHADGCDTCAPRRAKAVTPLRTYGAFAEVRAPVTVRSGVMGAADAHFGTTPPSTGLRLAIPVALALLLLAGVGGIALGLRSTEVEPAAGPPTAAAEPVPSPSPSPTPEPSPTPTLDTLGSPSPTPSPEPTSEPATSPSPSPSPSPTADPTPTPSPAPEALAVRIERPAAGGTFDATGEDQQGRPAAVVPVAATTTGGTAGDVDVVWTSSQAPGEVLLDSASGDVLLWLTGDCTDTVHELTARATDGTTGESTTSTVQVTAMATCVELGVGISSPPDQTTIAADQNGTVTVRFSGEANDEVDWTWTTDRQQDGVLLEQEGGTQSSGEAQLGFSNCQGTTQFRLIVEVRRASDDSTARGQVTVNVDCAG